MRGKLIEMLIFHTTRTPDPGPQPGEEVFIQGQVASHRHPVLDTAARSLMARAGFQLQRCKRVFGIQRYDNANTAFTFHVIFLITGI